MSRRLAADFEGLGRRVAGARVPGGRLRWVPEPEPPSVLIGEQPLDDDGLGRWLDEDANLDLDPERGPGWRLAAVPLAGGGTLVSLRVHHSYTDGRRLIEMVGRAAAPTDSGSRPPAPGLMAETLDVVARTRDGVGGALRLTQEVASVPWRDGAGSDLVRLREFGPRLERRAFRRPLSRRLRRGVELTTIADAGPQSFTALGRLDARAWTAAAEDRGGTGNSLFIAVVANLVRRARRSRAAPDDGALRIGVPMDLRRAPAEGSAAGAIANVRSTVLLPPGRLDYGDLGPTRAAAKRAFRTASAAAEGGRGDAPRPPAWIDAAHLIPYPLLAGPMTARFEGSVDAVASNIGEVPDSDTRMGTRVARDFFALSSTSGAPGMKVVLVRRGDAATISVVAAASQLGAGTALKQLLAEELDAWRLPAQVL